MREVGLRLKLSKTTVATYLLRAREAGLNCWPLPSGRDDDATLKQVLFQRVGRPARDLSEPDWPKMIAEMKRKGVTLVLLWEEYRAAHPDGYGYTWLSNRAPFVKPSDKGLSSPPFEEQEVKPVFVIRGPGLH